MTRELEVNKLYELESGSAGKGVDGLNGGLKPTISFKGVSGTIKVYGANEKPTNLSDMITQSVDDVTEDLNFKLEGVVKYIAFAGGTATGIFHSSELKFNLIGDIT